MRLMKNVDFRQVALLNAQGMSLRKIAKHLGVDHSNLSKAFKNYKERLNPDGTAGDPASTSARSKSARQTDLSADKPADQQAGLFVSDLNHDDWIAKYCGFAWKLDYLTQMREFLWNEEKGLCLEPRGHGKSYSVVGLIVRHILEVRTPVLVITAPKNNNRFFDAILKALQNPAIINDYGEVIERSNRTFGEIRTKRANIELDPSIKVAARGQEIIGLHPAWLHMEDIISKEYKSEESNQDIISWYEDIVSYTLIEGSRLTVTGTRKGLDDFYSYLMTKNFSVLHKKALELVSGRYPTPDDIVTEISAQDGLYKQTVVDIRKTGEFKTLNCPNWTLNKLLYERITKYESFESEMQNNPLPDSGLYFEKVDWHEVDDVPLSEFSGIYISVDPAYSTSKSADFTAIIVAGIRDGKVYVIDGIIDRLSPDKLLQNLHSFNALYRPLQIFFESNALQYLLKQMAYNQGLPVIGVVQQKNKILRIDALKIHFKGGKILITENNPIKQELYNEYMQYNQKQSKGSRHDDGLDALTMLMENISFYVASSKLVTWYN